MRNLNHILPNFYSEVWIGKSLELAFLFLPHDCPLVGQILNVYNNLHSIINTPIVIFIIILSDFDSTKILITKLVILYSCP